MTKRLAVQVLRDAGHSQSEVAAQLLPEGPLDVPDVPEGPLDVPEGPLDPSSDGEADGGRDSLEQPERDAATEPSEPTSCEAVGNFAIATLTAKSTEYRPP